MKATALYALLSTIIALPVVSQSAPGLKNEKFESDFRGWSRSGNVSLSGRGTVKLDCDVKDKFTVLQQKVQGVRIGDVIEFEADLKSSQLGSQIIICEGGNWGSKKVLFSAKGYYKNKDKWQTLSIRKEIKELPVYVGVGLYRAAKQELFVRAITIKKIDKVTSLTLREAADPWDPMFKPSSRIFDKQVFKDAGGVEIYAAGNEYAIAAVMVYNPTADDIYAKVKAKPNNALAKQIPAGRLEIREAVHIRARLGQLVADPLPLISQDNVISIPAGETRQIWLELFTGTLSPGKYSLELEVEPLRLPESAAIPVNFNVMNFRLPEYQSRDIITWDCSLSRSKGILRDKLLETLRSHRVNTFHILAEMPAKFKGSGEMVGKPDFTELDDILNVIGKKNTKVWLRGGNFLRKKNTDAILDSVDGVGIKLYSNQWKVALRHWVEAVRDHMHTLGYDKSQWCFYPYDEYVGEYYLKFVNELREIDPTLKVFADPCGVKKENSDYDSLLKLAEQKKFDILCPSFGKYYPNDKYVKISKKMKDLGIKQYFYSCPVVQKRLSPVNFYRVQGWRMFDYELDGGGYWTSIGLGGNKRWGGNPWNDFDDKQASPVTVYHNSLQVVPSRRWQAFRAGLEDYCYIELLEKSLSRPQIYELFGESGPQKDRDYEKICDLRRRMSNRILALSGHDRIDFPREKATLAKSKRKYVLGSDMKEPEKLELILKNYLKAAKNASSLPQPLQKLVVSNASKAESLVNAGKFAPASMPEGIEKIAVEYAGQLNPESIKLSDGGSTGKLRLYNVSLPYSQWVAIQAEKNAEPCEISVYILSEYGRFKANQANTVQLPSGKAVDVEVIFGKNDIVSGQVELNIIPLDHLNKGAVRKINIQN